MRRRARYDAAGVLSTGLSIFKNERIIFLRSSSLTSSFTGSGELYSRAASRVTVFATRVALCDGETFNAEDPFGSAVADAGAPRNKNPYVSLSQFRASRNEQFFTIWTSEITSPRTSSQTQQRKVPLSSENETEGVLSPCEWRVGKKQRQRPRTTGTPSAVATAVIDNAALNCFNSSSVMAPRIYIFSS